MGSTGYTTINIHRVTDVVIHSSEDYGKDEDGDAFFKRDIVITDEAGNSTVIALYMSDDVDVTIR